MDDIYAAILRIQELENENQRLRKQVKDTERRLDDTKYENMSMLDNLTHVKNSFNEERFMVTASFPLYDSARVDMHETIQHDLVERFKRTLGEELYARGFIKDLRVQQQDDTASRTRMYGLTGTLKISK